MRRLRGNKEARLRSAPRRAAFVAELGHLLDKASKTMVFPLVILPALAQYAAWEASRDDGPISTLRMVR